MGSKVPPITPIRRIASATSWACIVPVRLRSIRPSIGAMIRDMTSVPDRARVRLTGISSRAYEHPADRSALVALRKLSGFDVLLSKLFGLFNKRALRLMFLAGGGD